MAPQSGIAAGLVSPFRPADPVLPVLFAVGGLAALTGGFVSIAPNRLLSGHPIGLFAAADMRLGTAIVVVAAILMLLAFWIYRRLRASRLSNRASDPAR